MDRRTRVYKEWHAEYTRLQAAQVLAHTRVMSAVDIRQRFRTDANEAIVLRSMADYFDVSEQVRECLFNRPFKEITGTGDEDQT